MTTRGQGKFVCPGCGQSDAQIVNRRKLRQEEMRSRTNRRMGTKSGDAEAPRVKMARLVKEKRREHLEECLDDA